MKEEGEYVEDELKRDETDAFEYSDVREMLFVDPVGSTETGEEDISVVEFGDAPEEWQEEP